MLLARFEPHVDNISLLIGAEANKERRRSLYSKNSSDKQNRTPRASAGPPSSFTVSDDKVAGEHDDETDAEPSPGFLGRASSVTSFSSLDSYNRLMHAHTKSQLDSPGMGTIPTYTKTMHAHTLHQLHQHRWGSSWSEAGNSRRGSKQLLLTAKVFGELEKLGLDDVPAPPLNTPEPGSGRAEAVVVGLDFGKLRRRSLTTSYGVRDYAAVEARDFAVGGIL